VLVAVTEFGSVWRRRFSKNEHDLNRFAHGAYFNTTKNSDDAWAGIEPKQLPSPIGADTLAVKLPIPFPGHQVGDI
jgi:hypothetical protein